MPDPPLWRPIHVSISSYDVASDDLVIYNVSLRCYNSQRGKWTVSHRYSNFFEMHRKIQQLLSHLSFSKFPGKSLRTPLTGATSTNFIEKRRSMLEDYLRSVVRHPEARCTRELQSFLALENAFADPYTGHSHDVMRDCLLGGRGPVFGEPLEVIMTRDRNVGFTTPWTVRACIEYLEVHGLEEEGLFRISAQKSAIDLCKDWIDMGRVPDFDCFASGAHVAAALLKLFLRSMPEPLFTFQLYDAFCSAIQRAETETRAEAIRQVISLLPPQNRYVLMIVLRLLNRVSERSDKNKMSTSNLVTIFGSLMLRGDDTAFGSLMGDASDAYMAISFMIDHSKLLAEDTYNDQIVSKICFISPRTNTSLTPKLILHGENRDPPQLGSGRLKSFESDDNLAAASESPPSSTHSLPALPTDYEEDLVVPPAHHVHPQSPRNVEEDENEGWHRPRLTTTETPRVKAFTLTHQREPRLEETDEELLKQAESEILSTICNDFESDSATIPESVAETSSIIVSNPSSRTERDGWKSPEVNRKQTTQKDMPLSPRNRRVEHKGPSDFQHDHSNNISDVWTKPQLSNSGKLCSDHRMPLNSRSRGPISSKREKEGADGSNNGSVYRSWESCLPPSVSTSGEDQTHPTIHPSGIVLDGRSEEGTKANRILPDSDLSSSYHPSSRPSCPTTSDTIKLPLSFSSPSSPSPSPHLLRRRNSSDGAHMASSSRKNTRTGSLQVAISGNGRNITESVVVED